MPGQTHALMQYSHDADAFPIQAVDDDMRANRVGPMRRRQIIPVVTKLRVETNRLEGDVDFVPVNQNLVLAPGLTGKAQDVDKVLPRLRG